MKAITAAAGGIAHARAPQRIDHDGARHVPSPVPSSPSAA
jgi:hypothetical protein